MESSTASSADKNWAYATFVTTDAWIIGAQVLLHSLQQHGSCSKGGATIDIVVLVTAGVTGGARTKLTRAGAKVVEVDPLSSDAAPAADGDESGSAGSTHVKSWAEVQYTKLRIWSLTQYSKVFYIGEPMVPRRRCDAASNFAGHT